MKGVILSGFLLVLVLAVAGNASAGVDDADGFSGLKWGTEYSTIKDEMTYVCTSPAYGGIRFYTRKNDELTIGPARVQYINYGFWHGKFFNVIAVVPNHESYDKLKKAVFRKYGEGQELRQAREFYTWTGKKTSIVVEYGHRFPGLGCLMMLSTEILNGDMKALAKGD
ncbi:MAG TPA: hypothetical protein PLA83_01705 [Deltaproteobacteria bacterium]|jgi:hypothetical protein|nr:hypothetical protein [Deltaproteobacteria bacterium]HQI00501.1 hypothetical protein [Deltaproteobacteria bacterium]HQJ08572.1 hypothetical protein [Deltaproteobacteria bacterium]